MRKTRFLTGLLATGLICAAPQTLPPVAPVHPVVDTYFGTSIADPYRWMEDLDDPATKGWMKAQNEYTRSVLATIPGRAALGDEIAAAATAHARTGALQIAGAHLFFRRLEPGQQSVKLLERDPRTGTNRVIFDPNASNDPQNNANLNLYTPDWDGAHVAIAVASGGSEDATLRVIDSVTGRALPDQIERARFAIPAWLPDNTGFLYTRLPKLATAALTAQNEKDAQVFVHLLGAAPDSDTRVFGRGSTPDFISEDWPVTYTSKTSHYAVTINVNGTANVGGFYVARISDLTAGRLFWRSLGNAVVDPAMGDPGTFGVITTTLHGDDLYAIRLDARRRTELVRLSLDGSETLAQAKIVISASDAVIDNVAAASDALYVRVTRAGIAHVVRVSYLDDAARPIQQPIAGTVSTYLATDPLAPGVTFGIESWTQSRAYFAYEPTSNTLVLANVESERAVDTSDLTSDEVNAVSADGTRVPLSIIHKRGIPLDGSHPTQLYGYGAYGISTSPSFNPYELPWLRRGGVWAIAHVRGGGEFGEPWHQAGKGANRERSVEDFVACARYLVDRGWTSTSKLAAVGGSAGGTLVGNALVQRPDLFTAVLDRVGVSDLLGSERGPNGPAQIPETGSVTTIDGFRNMLPVSPYQHIVNGTRYPAVLLTTGVNDPRVPPWMVLKMTARLQAATTRPSSILLRVDYNGGHMGASSSQFVDERADEESFLLWRLGDRAFQPV